MLLSCIEPPASATMDMALKAGLLRALDELVSVSVIKSRLSWRSLFSSRHLSLADPRDFADYVDHPGPTIFGFLAVWGGLIGGLLLTPHVWTVAVPFCILTTAAGFLVARTVLFRCTRYAVLGEAVLRARLAGLSVAQLEKLRGASEVRSCLATGELLARLIKEEKVASQRARPSMQQLLDAPVVDLPSSNSRLEEAGEKL